MRQQSRKIYVLKTDYTQVYFSKALAIAAGHKRKELERFDSLQEFDRFKELVRLQEKGAIRKLECHPKFNISPRFPTTYSPDFTYERLHKWDTNLRLWEILSVSIKVATQEEMDKASLNAIAAHQHPLYWVSVAEDVKGVTTKKTAKGKVKTHLLRREHKHIFERFQESHPKYHFELYPPLP